MKKMLQCLLTLVIVVILTSSGAAAALRCSFNVTGIIFGNVDTLSGAALDSTGAINITCTSRSPTKVRICPNIGSGSGRSTGAIRHMRNGRNQQLNYSLFQDPARTVPWGDVRKPELGNPPPIDITIGTVGSVSTSRTIYGRVFGSQKNASAGLYKSSFFGGKVRFNYATYVLNPPTCSLIRGKRNRPKFTVQANVVPNCKVTTQNINFGNHGTLNTRVDAAGSLGITCTEGTAYVVGLNNGLTGTGSTERRMTLGNEAVIYGLYKDANRTQSWGNSRRDIKSGTGSGTRQSLPVYGRVPAQATPSSGTYIDTVVVTVTY